MSTPGVPEAEVARLLGSLGIPVRFIRRDGAVWKLHVTPIIHVEIPLFQRQAHTWILCKTTYDSPASVHGKGGGSIMYYPTRHRLIDLVKDYREACGFVGVPQGLPPDSTYCSV